MKTWHLLALGVAAFAVARAVNTYRGTHYRQDPGQDGTRRPSWLEGLGGVVGIYHFPSPVNAPGAITSMLPGSMMPTPQPSAGQSGLPSYYTDASGIK